MREDDGIRFRHMLDAAREAVKFLRGRTRNFGSGKAIRQ